MEFPKVVKIRQKFPRPRVEAALQTAICCYRGVPPEETRFVRIPNTLHLEYPYVSEGMVDEALRNAEVEAVGDPAELRFDAEGYFEVF